MTGKISSYFLFILSMICYCSTTSAFIPQPQPVTTVSIRSSSSKQPFSRNQVPTSSTLSFYPSTNTQTSTNLYMYNLPPDNNKNNNGLSQFIPSIVSLLALGLFFFSPLGALFFAFTNTLFAFAVLAPFIFYIGFQIWQYFYTIEGPCPTCGAPVRVLKDVQQPSICFNCGSQVISNSKMNGVDLYDDVDSIMDRQRSIWDTFFSMDEDQGVSSYRSTQDTKETFKRTRREQTIIDVDISDD